MLSLADLMRAAIRRWYIVGGIIAAGIVLGLAVLLVLPTRHYAELVVAPAAGVDGSSSGREKLGDLVSLTGVDLGFNHQTGRYDLYLLILRSSRILRDLPPRHFLYQRAFYSEWDDQKNEWHRPDGLRFQLKKAVFAVLGRDAWQPPDATRLAEWINDHLTIKASKTSGVYVLSFEGRDPEFARRALDYLHNAADTYVRLQELERATASLQFIGETVGVVQIPEQQAFLANLWSREESTRILALAENLPFAAQVIEGPVFVPSRTRPSVGKSLVLFAFLGLGAALGTVYFKAVRDQNHTADNESTSPNVTVPAPGDAGRPT